MSRSNSQQSQQQPQTKSESGGLSQKDHARLMHNTPETANRWFRLGKIEVPILHLGIGDLTRFKAAFEPIGEVYEAFVKSDSTLADFMLEYRSEITDLFCTDIPATAAIVLAITPDEAIRVGTPLELLGIVIAQWNHNLEINLLKQLYPHPDDDEEEEEDDSEANPLSVLERLMSAYNAMTYEAALRQTIPQVYLMGHSSAVAYKKIEEKHEAENPSSTKARPAVGKKDKRGIFFEDKWWKRPNEMGAARYKRYLSMGMAAAYQNKNGGYTAMA